MEVAQSAQQTAYGQYHQLLAEQSNNKIELARIISEILENPSLNTFSEFLNLKQIEEVSNLMSKAI